MPVAEDKLYRPSFFIKRLTNARAHTYTHINEQIEATANVKIKLGDLCVQ